MLSKIQMVNSKLFFIGSATLYIREGVKDAVTKISSLQEKSTQNFKCRLSFSKSVSENDNGAVSTKKILTLFTPPDIIISEGSKIVVNQNNSDYELKSSSIPSVYSTHREYIVEQWEKWQ